MVVVPTKYYKTPAQDLADMGVSMVIFANHNMRASVTAMQKASARIFKDKSLVGVEGEVSNLFGSIIFSRLITWHIVVTRSKRLHPSRKFSAFKGRKSFKLPKRSTCHQAELDLKSFWFDFIMT